MPNRFFVKRFFYSKLFIIALFFMAGLIIFGLSQIFGKWRAARINEKNIKKEIEEAKNKYEELLVLDSSLDNQEFLDREARLNLNLRKPGEKVIIIKDDVLEEIKQTVKPPVEKEKSFFIKQLWNKILRIFNL